MFVIGRVGGWSKLAAVYPLTRPFTGERWHMRSARFGWSAYNGVITMGADPVGLYLAVMFPFRPGHPPMFIPWSEISAVETRFIFTYYALSFARAPGVTVKIHAGLAEKVAEASRGMFKPDG